MDDLISREETLTAFADYVGSGMSMNDFDALWDIVTNIPSVKPQEKTGHWIHYEGMLICSECGTEFYDDIMEYCGDDVPKCCPDCGRRMFEPQKGAIRNDTASHK